MQQQVHVNINKVNLDNINIVKYLGLCLDRSLRWGKHINEICKKSRKFLNIFNVLAGPSWGVHPIHLRRLYIAIIRSRLDFASFLFDNSAKCHIYKLDKIQNQAMRVIGGFIKSCPIRAMESELCLPPLHIPRNYLVNKYLLKAMSVDGNESVCVVSALASICDNAYWSNKRKPLLVSVHNNLSVQRTYCSKGLEMFSLSTWMSNIDIVSHISLTIKGIERPEKQHNLLELLHKAVQMINNNFAGFYQIYTDGSKDENGTGAAFFDPQTDTTACFKVNHKSPIMVTELYAILESLSHVQTCDSTDYVILCDSKGALQHLALCTSGRRGLPVAYSIIEILLDLQLRDKTIKFQWIPSHVNLVGNELADKLAKSGICDGIPVNCLPFFF